MSDNNVEVKFGGDASGAISAAQDAASAVKHSVDNMKGTFESLGSIVNAIQGPFLALSAILAGGAIFKESMKAATDWNTEVTKLSRSMGVTTEQASVMAVALDHIGVSTETYTQATVMMSRQLANNQGAFKTLGVAVRDADTGAFRPITQIMTDVNDKLKGIGNITEQNIAGMKVYGRGWGEVRQLLKMNSDTMKEAQETAERLHLIVGPEGEAMTRRYKEEQRDMNLVMKSLQVQVGDALLPVMVSLGAWMGEEGPRASGILATALTFLAELAVKLYYTFLALGSLLVGVSEAVKLAFTGNFSEAGEAIKKMTSDIDALGEKANQVLAKMQEPQKKSGARDKGTDVDLSKPQKGASQMGEWEQELAAKKVLYQQEHDLREMSKADEIAYWQSILTTQTTSGAEQIAIKRKIAQAQLEEMKKERADEKALDTERITQVEKMGLAEITAAQTALKAKKDLNQISAQDEVAGLLALENQKYQIELKALQDKAALYDQDKVARQKALDAIELLEQAHAKNVQKIDSDMAIEQQKSVASWVSPITGAFTTAINGIIQGTQTLQQAMTKIFQSILLSFVNNLVNRMVDHWVVGELTKLIYSEKTQATLTAQQTAASTAIVATKTVEGSSVVGINTAEMATGSAAAVAPTPFIGPGLAAAAFASAIALGLSSKSLFSASGGFDIPSGMDPITQLHREEMVLPAHIANPLRDVLGSIGAATSGFGIPSGLNPVAQMQGIQVQMQGSLPGPSGDGASGNGGSVISPNMISMPGGFFAMHRNEFAKMIKAMHRDNQLRPA